MFDLINPAQFKKLNFSKYIYHTSNEHLGVVLIPMDNVKVSKSKLQQISSCIFKNQNNKGKIIPINKDEIFKISYSDNKHHLSVFRKKDGFTITGKLNYDNSKTGEKLISNNTKSNIHITANQLPNFISSFLQEKLNHQLFNTPAIKGLSINYQGLEIKESLENDFTIIPNLNAHFQLDSILTQKRFLKIFEPIKSISIDTLTNSLFIGEQKFEYLISNNHLYFGFNQSTFKTVPSQTIFQFRGRHRSIFSIKGPTFITGFIEMLPPYFISKNYAKSIHKIEFNIEKNKANSALLVNGELKMKAEKNLYHETLKMILDFQSLGL